MNRRAAIASIALTLAACSSGIDDRIRAAHARVETLTAAQAAQLVAFCAAARAAVPSGDGYARIDALPRLPSKLADVPPTTVHAAGATVALEWWNNSHAEEDAAHPAFDVVCAAGPRAPGDRALGRGLWLHDVPPAD